jgi:hypothetical protein
MLSFLSVIDRMSKKHFVYYENVDEIGQDKATNVVRSGINLDQDFWDNFISILNNANGVAELFDVPREKVTNWASRIKEIINKINSEDNEKAKGNKAEIVPTGNEPLADPNGMDASPNEPAETRPMP